MDWRHVNRKWVECCTPVLSKLVWYKRFSQSIAGCVMKEDNDYLFVLLGNGSNICIRNPQFDRK
eukprot:3349898-Ditylum_brightwellii.AAC.1